MSEEFKRKANMFKNVTPCKVSSHLFIHAWCLVGCARGRPPLFWIPLRCVRCVCSPCVYAVCVCVVWTDTAAILECWMWRERGRESRNSRAQSGIDGRENAPSTAVSTLQTTKLQEDLPSINSLTEREHLHTPLGSQQGRDIYFQDCILHRI
ncbi:hypothetical protein WMY93_019207 [Mugilogobius chulae]|uniref:Uncharacterized protein n=1 Tax=Mugilogobius chulae TaxID=88201 RepID=A0AAW0NQQ8_9GOBI